MIFAKQAAEAESDALRGEHAALVADLQAQLTAANEACSGMHKKQRS